MVEDVETATPLMWWVHVDHLNRPVKMTNAAKASVWDAVWTPWGSPHSITGTGAINARFPGQWFQLEAGCTTTGTGTMIQPSAATPSLTRWVSWMGRVCMGMRVVYPGCWWTPMAEWRQGPST